MIRRSYSRYPGLHSFMFTQPLEHRTLLPNPRRKSSSTSATAVERARLPIPKLENTLQGYLKSLVPFLQEDEALGGRSFKEAMAVREAWVDDFQTGLGQVLQQRLKELDARSPNNWLDDNIWLRKVYHEWRAPLLVNSNWWLAFRNDPNTPLGVQVGLGPNPEIASTGITTWQVRRAAWLVYRTLKMKHELESQEIYPDTTKTGVWFRSSAMKIFNIARVPRPECDEFSDLAPPDVFAARTILCMVRDWLYAVEVVDREGRPLPPRTVETNILDVVRDAGRRAAEGEQAVPLSVLTADHRDTWAKNRVHLSTIDPRNSEILQHINHSLFGLSLDHYTYVLPTDRSAPATPLPVPDSPAEVDAHLHNLRSSHPQHPGRNRWHDKPYTLIVESNGRAGAEGEHSPVDALVPSIVADYSVVEPIDEAAFDHPLDAVRPTKLTRLDFVVDDHIKEQCHAAESVLLEIVRDSDDSVLWFDAYGVDWIQNSARLASDAYIQLAMQLAWYRDQGSFTAVYETALTRMFKNGRTETIRSYTAEARDFVLAMVGPDASSPATLQLLHRAVQTHTNLTRAAIVGKGIDRHLLGLRCMMRPESCESHKLFDDELFTRSQTWKLSTSALSAGDQFRGTGFGTPEHDGYGINYLAGPSLIKFGVESKKSCRSTSTQAFKAAISDALLDMRTLCQTASLAHL